MRDKARRIHYKPNHNQAPAYFTTERAKNVREDDQSAELSRRSPGR